MGGGLVEGLGGPSLIYLSLTFRIFKCMSLRVIVLTLRCVTIVILTSLSGDGVLELC